MSVLFQYTDFQKFLRDWKQSRKELKQPHSYEFVAEKIGIKSRGHAYRLFHDPKIRISKKVIFRLSDLLEFTRREQEYFELLILYQCSSSELDRAMYLKKMGKIAGKNQGALSLDAIEFLSEWYYPVLREAICLPSFNGSIKKLQKSFLPSVEINKIKTGIQKLEALQLVQKLPGGRYKATNQLVHIPGNMQEALVASFQKQMMDVAAQALDKLPFEKREMGTLTFSMDSSNFQKIKTSIKNFQKEITQLILEQEGREDSVYQLNFQCFPLYHEQ